MTRLDSHKEISGSDNQVHEDYLLDGTSARTRPLSFDDIMLRRKNKGDPAKQNSSALSVADIESAQDNTGKPFDIPENHRQINYDLEPMDEKKNSNHSQKVRSDKKWDIKSSRKNEKLVQVNAGESLNPDARSKNKGARNTGSNRVLEGKIERGNHGNRKKDDLSSIDSDNEPDKRNAKDSYKKVSVSERSRVKSEIVKGQVHIEERQVYRKRKTDGRVSSDSDNEHKKRNAKDVRQTDKLSGGGREKPEKEYRQKRRHEEDKARGRITVSKKDLEKKGPEPARPYYEESRPKRRRSRSKEREKDRGRRSLSQSPKANKHASKDRRELGEPSSHSTKERPGRDHSDIDKKRISSNGSGSHYRRNANSSGLGGYSPRKRKTEAAAKTPSPTRRSPERRGAGWDLHPDEKESIVAGPAVSNLNTSSLSSSLNIKEFPSVTPAITTIMKPIGISLHALSSQMHAMESIQLTQSTRPMRRLYVENLPASASEEGLKECVNNLLLSSGVNYIQGTQPCISCIIHKEKCQALLEFLTPEFASSALSLNGMSFSGCNLKLRRPRDYANVTTGLSDKSVSAADSVTDIVEDSPNKIFIGGVSKLFSSKMLLEIARAFGSVKAFHFEFVAEFNEPCAFLEYVDHSVTSKACAGLNGMKLGGQVLTAVLATSEPVLENDGKLPIYGIPKHAKPLLEKPTTVLKLKNVLDPECLSSLSESELEEILQDIKIECSRFGTVKSINIAKEADSFTTMEPYDVQNTGASSDLRDLDFANRSYTAEKLGKSTCGIREIDISEPPKAPKLEDNSQTLEDKIGRDNSTNIPDPLIGSTEPDDTNRPVFVGDSLTPEIILKDEISKPPINGEDFSMESNNQEKASDIELQSNYGTATSTSTTNLEMEVKPSTTEELKPEQDSTTLKSSEEELKSEENNQNIVSCAEFDTDERKELDAPVDKKDVPVDFGHVFELGSVFVEYRRVEAACMAAHCLHGRAFDGRVVTVEYVGHDIYQTRFRR